MVRRAMILVLSLLAGCGGGPAPLVSAPAEVPFRVLAERANPASCVAPPAFALAATEDQWIDAFDRDSDCHPTTEITLPPVRFPDEIAVAAWWRTVPCGGYGVRTETIREVAGILEVRARASSPPPGTACTAVTAVLQSFLAVRRASPGGAVTARFFLDGERVGDASS